MLPYVPMVLQLAQVLAVIGSAAISIFVYLKTRSDQRFKQQAEQTWSKLGEIERELNEIDERVDHFRDRLALAEARLREMPTHRDLEGLRVQISTANNQLSALDERSRATLTALGRIETFLLDGVKNR